MKFPAKIVTRWILLVCLAGLASSCVSHPDPYVRRGRIGGAALGAGIGAIIGNNSSKFSKTEGAIAGVVLGGILGDARGKANSSYYGRREYHRWNYRAY